MGTLHIENALEKHKSDIRAIYSQELMCGYFSRQQADKIINIFEREIARVCFIPTAKYVAKPEDVSRRRKIMNILTFINRSDWTNPKLIELMEIIFTRIFSKTSALSDFSKHIKKIKNLVREYHSVKQTS